MQFSGLAGEIVGWIVVIVAYAIVAAGIFNIVYYLLIEILLRKSLQYLKIYKRLTEFFYYYHSFMEWRKVKENEDRKVD